MEYWVFGLASECYCDSEFPTLQYSITPVIHFFDPAFSIS
jgi:hypothetical protein